MVTKRTKYRSGSRSGSEPWSRSVSWFRSRSVSVSWPVSRSGSESWPVSWSWSD